VWLAIDRETFYEEAQVVILGMAFCYPGRDGKGGDLPARPDRRFSVRSGRAGIDGSCPLTLELGFCGHR
jgi:hypothetical protein